MNAIKFIKQHRNNIVCYGSLTLVFILFAILTKGKIYSAYNLKSLVGQMVVLMIISVGMIFMFAHGTVDIASGAVAGLCTMVITLVLNATGNVPVSVLASIATAVALYLFMWFVTAYLGLMSIIASLAVMFIARGMVTYILSLHDGRMNITRYDLIQPLKSNVAYALAAMIIIALIGIVLFNYTKLGKYCKACPECNGRACKNQMPGPGSKGIGDTAIRNYDKWKEIRVNMDTIAENKPVDTSLSLFGRTFKYPVFAGPVGAVQLHYGDCLDDVAYNDILVSACAKNGIAAFTGDGTDPNVMVAATKAIKNADGAGIPTVKPWNIETIREKMELVHESGAFAVAMDIDAAGLPFLKNLDPPAGSKTVSELCDIIQMAGTPFIVKGIMTVKGALKAKEAGASAIIVSNHGGRVLDQCPATAEVLESIVKALEGSDIKVLVDGGIRSGTDVFKALALGADGVLIARPFVTAVYGGKADGVRAYIDKIGTELEDTMKMCGVSSLDEITRDCVMTF